MIRNSRSRLWPAAAGFVIFIAACFWIHGDYRISLLEPGFHASWIGFPEPLYLGTRPDGDVIAYFRKRFRLKSPVLSSLNFSALRLARISLDGAVIAQTSDIRSWKKAIRVHGPVSPGEHELVIAVNNHNGPPALYLYSSELSLASGPGWEASRDGSHWIAAVAVESYKPAPISQMFPSAREALARSSPVLAVIFLVVFFWSLYIPIGLNAEILRRVLWTGWFGLAINNIVKLPLNIGFDVGGHMEYVRHVALLRRLPLASEGWQMFQSPLYYLVSAPLYLLSDLLWSPDVARRLMRVLPLLCGAAQVELSFQAAKIVFPGKMELQALAALLGGLMPMNIYVSQTAGNEPLAGFLTSLFIVMALRLGASQAKPVTPTQLCVLGGVFGLALLAKVTPVLLILPFTLYWRERLAVNKPYHIVIVFFAAAIICGWYYLRNWWQLGVPFVGGWDEGRQIIWWQYPGYRNFHSLFSWGHSLHFPVYAALAGFWDSIYSTLWLDGCLSSIIEFRSRPPWNYSFMISGACLGLLPCAAILLGMFRVFFDCASRPALRFAAMSVIVYLAAMLALYIKVPIYSTAKATYMVGLSPFFALLACKGFEFLIQNTYARATVMAWMACWGVSAYYAYFIL